DQVITTEQLLHFLRSGISRTTNSNDINSNQHNHSHELREAWSSDFDHVEHLLILKRVLDQPTSAIQTCRIADFLELEVLGRMTAKGKQCASVFIGEPISVLSFLQNYESDKSSAVEQLLDVVHRQLQSALDNTRVNQDNRSPVANSVSPNVVLSL
ncbi:MAG: hypothetical protein K2Z81_01080, partial [Cyanobacteria bacterium]|nr:hypothetical protein [Cyanobacteriota bacterium]